MTIMCVMMDGVDTIEAPIKIFTESSKDKTIVYREAVFNPKCFGEDLTDSDELHTFTEIKMLLHLP